MIKEFFLNIVGILHESHPFRLLMQELLGLFVQMWEYQIFTTADKQKILVSNIVLGIILFIVGLKIAKYLSNKIAKKFPSYFDKNTASALKRVLDYILLIIISIFVLDIAHVPLTVFAVIGTTFAIGIGLGSQFLANNFMSGLVIMIERPIRIGDIIEVNKVIGKVTSIGARCVRIRTEENINMLIPNSHILQDMIINWTLEDTTLKVGLLFIIDDKSDIKTFDDIVINLLKNHQDILKTPMPEILLKGICKDGYKIELKFWIDISISNDSKYVINKLNRELVPILKKHHINVIDEEEIEYSTVITK